MDAVWGAIKSVVLALLCLGCTPTFNWRDVGFEGLPVVALLPCKPDRGTRQVPLAGALRTMTMAGCASGGAMFTVAVIDVGDASQMEAAQTQLQAASKAAVTPGGSHYDSRYYSHARILVQAAIHGQPQAGKDGPGALSAQVGETFFGGVQVIKP